VSDCCLTPIEQCFSYIIARTSYILMKWWWWRFCTRPTRWAGIFILLAHWDNRPRWDLSLYLDTLAWFRANQY